MMYYNKWQEIQDKTDNIEEYIAAGIMWELECTGEFPDMDYQLMVAYGEDGGDEQFLEKFGKQSREQLEQILMNIVKKSIKSKWI